MTAVRSVECDALVAVTGSRAPDVPRSPGQPAAGLRGLVLVVPIATALAIGAGGEGSVRILAPIITYSLPLVVMVAFWWADWPGSRFRASRAGWIDTALIAVGAIVLTGIGQALAGHLDPIGLFDPSPGPGHVPTFPATLPLGGTAFVAMLQFTLVGEGWPLHRLRPLLAGLVAVALSWIVAVAVYFGVVGVVAPSGSAVVTRSGPVPGTQLGAVLVLIGAAQVLGYVCWRGWPFSMIRARTVRLACGHVIVLGAGILTFVAGHRLLGFDPVGIAAVAGCFIAAGLVFGMLFEGWFAPLGARAERAVLLLLTLALTVVLAIGLSAVARTLPLSGITTQDWVEHATLNALSTSIILHVAIGRRWPFLPNGEGAQQPSG